MDVASGNSSQTSSIGISGRDLSFAWLVSHSEIRRRAEARGKATSLHVADGKLERRRKRARRIFIKLVKQGETARSAGSQLSDSEEALFEEAYGALTSAGAASGEYGGFIRLLQVDGEKVRSRRLAMATVREARHRDSTAAAATAATASATADSSARTSAAHTSANPDRAGREHDGGALERPSSYDRRGTASRRQGLLSTEEDRGPSGASSSRGDDHGGSGGGGASDEGPDSSNSSSQRAGSPLPAAAASFPTPGVTGPPEAGDVASPRLIYDVASELDAQNAAARVSQEELREPFEVPVQARLLEAPLRLASAPRRPAPDHLGGIQWTLFQLFGIVVRNIHTSARLFWVTMLDVWLLLSAAFIVGVLQGTAWELRDVPANVSMAYLVQAVLNAVVHLRVFTASRNVQRHEVSRGVAATAVYVASLITDLVWIALSPAIYYSVYHFVVVPRASFSAYYTVGLLVCWWSSGLAYTVSLSFIPPQAQLLFTVVLILLIGAFLHGLSPSIASARGSVLEALLGFSYSRWAMEAATIQEFRQYGYRSTEVLALYYDKGICGVDEKLVDDGDGVVSPREAISLFTLQKDYADDGCQRYYTQACAALFGMGLGWRALAFLQMCFASYRLQSQVRCGRCADRLVAVAKAMWFASYRLLSQVLCGHCAPPVLNALCGAGGRCGATFRYFRKLLLLSVEEYDKVCRSRVAAWYRKRAHRDGHDEIEAACREGLAEVLDELLRAGTRLSKEELGGETKERVPYKPLEEAIRNGHTEVVRVLMGWNENVLDTLVGGMSPLHFACYRGQRDVVELLLQEGGASPGEQDGKGNRPMHVAAREGHSQVVELLLREDPGQLDSSNKDNTTPLQLACDRMHLSVLEVMLRHFKRGRQGMDGRTPLNTAAAKGYLEVVRALLDTGANKDAPGMDGWTPLHTAAKKGYLELVRALLDAGANKEAPNRVTVDPIQDNPNGFRIPDGWTPLHTAAYHGRLEVVRALLDAGANTNALDKNRSTPLHTAAEKGHLEVVRALLDAGANTDALDEDGVTPLHEAARNGHTVVVRALLDAGANKEAPNRFGFTPLHTAVRDGCLEVVWTLLDAGANTDTPDKDGVTPLHEAVGYGPLELVRALLDAGANTDAPDKDGMTPLHEAARYERLDVVRALLDAGANTDALDKRGRTALHVARNEAIARVLA